MFDFWSRYRQHAKFQFIIFYEENSHIDFYNKHIECNKQFCYFCYNVIRHHDVFEIDDDDQFLYFLWTIKDTINFEISNKIQNFRFALRMICHDLKLKIRKFRITQWRCLEFIIVNEFVFNFSRIFLTLITNRELSLEIKIETTNIDYAITFLNFTRSKLIFVSQSHFAIISKTSFDDFEEIINLDKTTKIDQSIIVTIDNTIFLSFLIFSIVISISLFIAKSFVQFISFNVIFFIIFFNISILFSNVHEIFIIFFDVESQFINNLVSIFNVATSSVNKITTMTNQIVQIKSNVSFSQTKIVHQFLYQH